MSKKLKNNFIALKYTEHFLILTSAVTGCVSTSTFASSVGIPIDIASFAAELNICARTALIKKDKFMVKKKNRRGN